jgi:hypothetical protein
VVANINSSNSNRPECHRRGQQILLRHHRVGRTAKVAGSTNNSNNNSRVPLDHPPLAWGLKAVRRVARDTENTKLSNRRLGQPQALQRAASKLVKPSTKAKRKAPNRPRLVPKILVLANSPGRIRGCFRVHRQS